MRVVIRFMCLAALSIALFNNPAAARDASPVILTGNDLPAFLGYLPDGIIAFNYTGGVWTDVPLQIDERAVKNGHDMYFEDGVCTLSISECNRIDIDLLVYTDENTFAGADDDPTFDSDDELVLRGSDASDQAPAGSYPAVVPNGSERVEIQVDDPVNSTTKFLYLFEKPGGYSPPAFTPDVAYNFVLLNPPPYNSQFGFNPENSTVVANAYTQHFSDRWIHDEISILLGTGVDILDRHKQLFPNYACSHTDEGYSYGEGVFTANISGPIRAIRAYFGSLSGPLVERNHFFYADHEQIVTKLRVHAIAGNMDVYDYNANAIGMTYYNNLNPGGLSVDGVPDAAATGELTYELMSGPQGSMYMVHQLETNVTLDAVTSRYVDAADNTGADPCTGDNSAYGYSGPELVNIPDTDPFTAPQNFLRMYRTVLYEGPNKTPADLSYFLQYQQQPLIISTDGGSVCLTPAGLFTDQIDKTTARCNWNAVTGAVSYTLQWRAVGAGSWNTIGSLSGTDHTLTGLDPDTQYEWQIKTVCGGDESLFSASQTFTTLLCNAAPVPTGLAAAAQSASTALLSWDDMDVESYDVELYQKRNNGARVLEATYNAVMDNQQLVSGLSDKKNYSFRVRSNCNGQTSAYTAYFDFNTAGARRGVDPASTADVGAVFSLSPNPTDGALEVRLEAVEGGAWTIEISDLRGRVVQEHNWKSIAGAHTLQLDVRRLDAAVYFVTLRDAEGRAQGSAKLFKF